MIEIVMFNKMFAKIKLNKPNINYDNIYKIGICLRENPWKNVFSINATFFHYFV